MSRVHTLEKLSGYVADFVLSDFPLHLLVGDDGMPGEPLQPDMEGLIELQKLLKSSGVDLCEKAADKIGVFRLMQTVPQARKKQ